MAILNLSLSGTNPAVKHLTNMIRNSNSRDPNFGVHVAEAIDSLVQGIGQIKGTVAVPDQTPTSTQLQIAL